MGSANDKRLFLACFMAIVTTAFGFIVRAMIMDTWATEFGLNETEKGEIFGVGLWPFAITIVLFSLLIDKIGYGRAMVFAFICHVVSVVVTVTAKGYWGLYVGNLIVALGNGAVEAVINPVVATMFPKEKTKWLNILHAGWPGGLVVGGLLAIALGATTGWQIKVGLILIPTILYGILMLGCKFPVNERVAAGVTYKDMLKEFGALGALVVVALIVSELSRVFGLPNQYPDSHRWIEGAIIAVLVLSFWGYVQSLGRPMFVFLLLIMIPLATTELGTDSWITPLMEPEMKALGLQAGWVLVYTSAIMMILRFFAGPIVHRISPLGLLAASALIAALGLVALSKSTGMMILAAATLYGFGKTFFWPTMLGVVAEQFPKGGALTLNATGGVGMLGVGVVGAAFLGNIQDKAIDTTLEQQAPAIHAIVAGAEQNSVFGKYQPLDPKKVAELDEADKAEIVKVQDEAKKSALTTVAIFPVLMFVCYAGLIVYFRAKGGYKQVHVEETVEEAATSEF